MSGGYLQTGEKRACFGCEACVQACERGALRMEEDEEGFRYPRRDEERCNHCGRCLQACPTERMPALHEGHPLTFGGYSRDEAVRESSTSGGAFSALAKAWAGDDGAVFGCEADGLGAKHSQATGREGTTKFRKSKYTQSRMGDAYREAKRLLREGRRVLFSGTPCQIAGLRSFLGGAEPENLLTAEVVCEGVPSPLYIRRFAEWLGAREGAEVTGIDYREKDGRRWDFQVMRADLRDGRSLKKDRWFNPFWSIWLQHLMSRPSCYGCPFARAERGADVTMGDLWGVHLYCPELYGKNGGASLVVCNTEKGAEAFRRAQEALHGHELRFEDALKYQGPMRKPMGESPRREAFMADLRTMPYEELVRKWAKRPTLKLLWQKYVWGNRQKMWLWNLTHGGKGRER